MTKLEKIHIIGIGGIGASALARIYSQKGVHVTGSDQNSWSMTDELQSEGIKVTIGHSPENLPTDAQKVIYSEAIPENNVELQKAHQLNIPCQTYFEALGELSKDYKTIAIAGAHGKTTVTAMATKVLLDAGFDPTVLIGSKMIELDDKNCRLGQSEWLVVEACEYRRSFLHLEPNIAIITNIEYEHPDYYKDFEDYRSAFTEFTTKPTIEKTITASPPVEFELQIPGQYNKVNAGNVMALAKHLGIDESGAQTSLQNYKGAWRRFEIKKPIGDTMIIDDYGHHPTEIKATLSAIKERWPEKKLLCVFQPHQYTRTAELLEDFTESFHDADSVIIPNIYKVRDTQEAINKVSPELLVAKINDKSHNARHGNGLENTRSLILDEANSYGIVIIMGAGDIWQMMGEY